MDPTIASAGISALGSLAGGLADSYFGNKAADKSYKFQKKVLQNQVQWRVEDAVKAGLHPLAALGVNPASGPSVSVGGSGLGGALADMGQNIGRAAEAYLTPQDKLAAKSALLAIEQQQANIDLTKSQIAGAQKALLSQGATPGIASTIPIPGTNTATMEVKNPSLAQKYQDHYGDWIENIAGGAAFVDDAFRHLVAEKNPLAVPVPSHDQIWSALSKWWYEGEPFVRPAY